MAFSFQSSTDQSSRPQPRSTASLRQTGQQRAAQPTPAFVGPHVQVFQVYPRSSQERGKILEGQRETHRLAVRLEAQQHLCRGAHPEKLRPQQVLVGDHLVQQPLELGQFTDQSERIKGTSASVAGRMSERKAGWRWSQAGTLSHPTALSINLEPGVHPDAGQRLMSKTSHSAGYHLSATSCRRTRGMVSAACEYRLSMQT